MSYAYLDLTTCLLNVKTLFKFKCYSITHIIENNQNGETQKHNRKHFIRLYLKDRLGDQRGGSEWEPIKILLEGD
jgi:hypothetical protein